MTLVITVAFGEIHRNVIYLIKLSQKINGNKTFTYTTATMVFGVFFQYLLIATLFGILAMLINYFVATKCIRYIYPIQTDYAAEDLNGIMAEFSLQ